MSRRSNRQAADDFAETLRGLNASLKKVYAGPRLAPHGKTDQEILEALAREDVEWFPANNVRDMDCWGTVARALLARDD